MIKDMAKKEIKRTKKCVGKTVTLKGFHIDNDLLPYIKLQPNKSRFVNDAIRAKLFG